jgi:hypothetical protein
MAGDFDSIEKGVGSYTPRMRKGLRVMYKPNHSSFGAFIRSEQMRKVTVRVAHDIARSAQARTPSQKEGAKEHTGLHQRVKDGFRVVETPVPRNLKVGGNLRVVVQVVNVAKGSALVEFGANGIPRQRMLGSAGAMFGDFHDGKEA